MAEIICSKQFDRFFKEGLKLTTIQPKRLCKVGESIQFLYRDDYGLTYPMKKLKCHAIYEFKAYPRMIKINGEIYKERAELQRIAIADGYHKYDELFRMLHWYCGGAPIEGYVHVLSNIKDYHKILGKKAWPSTTISLVILQNQNIGDLLMETYSKDWGKKWR